MPIGIETVLGPDATPPHGNGQWLEMYAGMLFRKVSILQDDSTSLRVARHVISQHVGSQSMGCDLWSVVLILFAGRPSGFPH